MITDRVKAWRPLVESEIARGGYPWPAEFILAVIAAESGGNVGEINKKSGASGLMQIMPVALKDFNNRTKLGYTMADMRAKDDRGAQRQIEVGLSILGAMWRNCAGYLRRRVPQIVFDDVAQLSQVFYVAGQGAAKKNLDTLPDPTFAALSKAFGGWSAVPYVRGIWSDTIKQAPIWDLDAIDRWIGGSGGSAPGDKKPSIAKNPKNGLLLGMAAIAVASFFLSKRGGIA